MRQIMVAVLALLLFGPALAGQTVIPFPSYSSFLNCLATTWLICTITPVSSFSLLPVIAQARSSGGSLVLYVDRTPLSGLTGQLKG